MTNSKVRNSDSAHSICFSQVLLKFFTFLINTTTFSMVFYSPDTLLLTGQTNKNTHTHKHKSSFNSKDLDLDNSNII